METLFSAHRIFKFIPFFLAPILITCSSATSPKAKMGLTAKEAEQLASSYALELLANPFLVTIETPESGGGLNRDGRLANGEKGKWWFGYHESGLNEGLIVETEGVRVAHGFVPLETLKGLQQILPDYIDSSEAIRKSESSGGKDLTEIKTINAILNGEPAWPKSNPRKVTWTITYELNDSTSEIFYIDAYTGVFLGKG